MENSSREKQPNWFVRIGLITLIGLIIAMIIYRYFYKNPIAEISSGIIVLIAFAIVLTLSESFDSFSVGKILTLNRELKNKETIIEKKNSEIIQFESEKRELLNQIINLSNNFSQRQSNTNIYGVSGEAFKQFTIQKADQPEVESLKQKEQEEENKSIQHRRIIDHQKLKEISLHKFIKDDNIDVSKLFKEVKLLALEGVDEIGGLTPIYDAYLNDIDREMFIEIRPTTINPFMFFDRLYVMLSKIHYYKISKKNNCYLNLIIVEIPEPDRDNARFVNRILELFRPSISSGILKVTILKLEQGEFEKVLS